MARILVVDDEVGIADILEGILTDEGHRVVQAGNGREALSRLAEHEIDLVVSDLMMPVMDGAALLRAIREGGIRSERRLPGFILMCALPEANIRDRISGYDAFLRKPFRIDSVIAAVDALLATIEPE